MPAAVEAIPGILLLCAALQSLVADAAVTPETRAASPPPDLQAFIAWVTTYAMLAFAVYLLHMLSMQPAHDRVSACKKHSHANANLQSIAIPSPSPST